MARIEDTRQTLQREGSPWTGLWAVVAKEMADQLTSVRMLVMEILILLVAVGTIYMAGQNLRSLSQDQLLFLRLFAVSQDPLPPLVSLLGFFLPIIAIAIAFDSINSEFNQRTIARLLAQPIYRDALLLGKFLANFFTLALLLMTVWLLVMGLGIVVLGVPPSLEEVARTFSYVLMAAVYGGIWLAVATFFSIRFRQPATSALASLAIWIFFTFFWSIIVDLITPVLQPARLSDPNSIVAQIRLGITLSRFSPNTLYSEAVLALLDPTTRALGLLLPSQLLQLQWAIPTPLPFWQSVALIWPHFTGLVAAILLLFALSYVSFQRQEIRA